MLRFGFLNSDYEPTVLFWGSNADLRLLELVLRHFANSPESIVLAESGLHAQTGHIVHFIRHGRIISQRAFPTPFDKHSVHDTFLSAGSDLPTCCSIACLPKRCWVMDTAPVPSPTPSPASRLSDSRDYSARESHGTSPLTCSANNSLLVERHSFRSQEGNASLPRTTNVTISPLISMILRTSPPHVT